MKSALTSKYYRPDGNIIEFEVDESAFKKTGTRNLVEVIYLDKTKSWVDWGYQNSGAKFEIGQIRLSIDNYNILLRMKEDNVYTEYLFHKLTDSWPCIITDVQKSSVSAGKIYTNLQLLIVDNPI